MYSPLTWFLNCERERDTRETKFVSQEILHSMKGDVRLLCGDSRNQAWSTGFDEKSQDLSLALRISPRKCKVAGNQKISREGNDTFFLWESVLSYNVVHSQISNETNKETSVEENTTNRNWKLLGWKMINRETNFNYIKWKSLKEANEHTRRNEETWATNWTKNHFWRRNYVTWTSIIRTIWLCERVCYSTRINEKFDYTNIKQIIKLIYISWLILLRKINYVRNGYAITCTQCCSIYRGFPRLESSGKQLP